VSSPDQTLEANAYAVSYRLLGDRPAARAVAGIAAERLRQCGGMSRPDWLYLLVEFTLDQTVQPGSLGVVPVDDEHSGLRTALRRRLERAAPDERVAAALVHLCGYPVEFVSGVVHRDRDETARLAGILAPPPGFDYRELGDPELTGRSPRREPARRGPRRPHWTTVVVVAVLVAMVIAATQVTGPRPTLGPPPEEGSTGVGTASAQTWPGDPAHE
jgi:hypothetical protein